jgi:aminoglycoside phosphotransferase (APT) family kinase protein
MDTSLMSFPDLETLKTGLISVFNAANFTDEIEVIKRQPNDYASTFPSEIITCRIGDETIKKLFCKYEIEQIRDNYGHRGGVEYEAIIYRDILQPLKVTAPIFFGSYAKSQEETWIFLEYLGKSERPLGNANGGLIDAARWIGNFHSLTENSLKMSELPQIRKYDAGYYSGWALRTAEFAESLHNDFPWLPEICERFVESINSIAEISPTLIHGEFYYKNVLFQEGIIYPIDWESAAFALGEIDFAALTEGDWDSELVRECEQSYLRARWSDDIPKDFQQRLNFARLYLHFRWLGGRANSTLEKNRRWRFRELHSIGKQLGLIG